MHNRACSTGMTCGTFWRLPGTAARSLLPRRSASTNQPSTAVSCELERQLGRRLVERHPSGYRLTAVGEELRPLAERIETAVQDLERRAASSDADLVGTVRVTCPETVGYRMMKTPLLDAFRTRYPGLRIELMMVDRVLDLAKGEADVAFRTAPPQDNALVSRKLADVPWAIFASRSYVDSHGQPERPRGRQQAPGNRVWWPHRRAPCGSVGSGPVAPNARVAAICTTTPALVLAVKSGAGLAPLPVAAVETSKTLFGCLARYRRLPCTSTSSFTATCGEHLGCGHSAISSLKRSKPFAHCWLDARDHRLNAAMLNRLVR